MATILVIGCNPPQRQVLETLLAKEHKLSFCSRAEAAGQVRKAQFDLAVYNVGDDIAEFQAFVKAGSDEPLNSRIIAFLPKGDEETGRDE